MKLAKHEVMSSAAIFGGAIEEGISATRVEYRRILDDVYAMDIDAMRSDAVGHIHGEGEFHVERE